MSHHPAFHKSPDCCYMIQEPYNLSDQRHLPDGGKDAALISGRANRIEIDAAAHRHARRVSSIPDRLIITGLSTLVHQDRDQLTANVVNA